jgi:hypothetical protein
MTRPNANQAVNGRRNEEHDRRIPSTQGKGRLQRTIKSMGCRIGVQHAPAAFVRCSVAFLEDPFSFRVAGSFVSRRRAPNAVRLS